MFNWAIEERVILHIIEARVRKYFGETYNLG